VGSLVEEREDITNLYKYKDGSILERATIRNAVMKLEKNPLPSELSLGSNGSYLFYSIIVSGILIF